MGEKHLGRDVLYQNARDGIAKLAAVTIALTAGLSGCASEGGKAPSDETAEKPPVATASNTPDSDQIESKDMSETTEEGNEEILTDEGDKREAEPAETQGKSTTEEADSTEAEMENEAEAEEATQSGGDPDRKINDDWKRETQEERFESAKIEYEKIGIIINEHYYAPIKNKNIEDASLPGLVKAVPIDSYLSSDREVGYFTYSIDDPNSATGRTWNNRLNSDEIDEFLRQWPVDIDNGYMFLDGEGNMVIDMNNAAWNIEDQPMLIVYFENPTTEQTASALVYIDDNTEINLLELNIKVMLSEIGINNTEYWQLAFVMPTS